MKWVVIGLSALVLAVGALALTTRGGGDVHQAVAAAETAAAGTATQTPFATPGRRSAATHRARNRQCQRGQSDDRDATGDDSVRSACHSDGGNDNSGDDRAGDGRDSSDDQAGDGRDGGD
jgi:hypothetical protein